MFVSERQEMCEGGGGRRARVPQSFEILRLILRNFEIFAILHKRKKRSRNFWYGSSSH